MAILEAETIAPSVWGVIYAVSKWRTEPSHSSHMQF